jgi:hypothetical protein
LATPIHLAPVSLVDQVSSPARARSSEHEFTDPPQPVIQSNRTSWGFSSRDLLASGILLIVFGLIVLHLGGFVNQPLSNDEQWRAYWSSLGFNQFLRELPGIPAPLGLGWLALEHLSIDLFGNSEWALRLPNILSIFLLALSSYFLARRLLPWSVSLLIGLALLFNGPMLVYGFALKEDIFVSACAVIAVLLWLGANDEDATTRGRWVRYIVLGLVGVFAVPAAIVIAPLLALDLWRAWRSGRIRKQLPLVATSAAIILANFVFYVHHSTAVLRVDKTYWQDYFVPHQIGGGFSFVTDQLRSFVPGTVSAGYLPPYFPYDTAVTKSPLPEALSVLIAIAMVLALVAGCIKIWRSRVGRTILAVIGGALLLELVGSIGADWPFGFVRVNLFLVPFLYVVMGAGVWALISGLRNAPKHASSSRTGAAVVLQWVLCAALLLGCVAGGFAGWRVQSSMAGRSSNVQYVAQLRSLVHQVRLDAKPGDVAVVIGDTDGWKYYMGFYDDAAISAHPRLSNQNTLFGWNYEPKNLSRFVASKHPKSVFIFDRVGVSIGELGWQKKVLGNLGYCSSGFRVDPTTGALFTLTHRNGPCPGS